MEDRRFPQHTRGASLGEPLQPDYLNCAPGAE
jgi:hypothetical protein